MCDLDEKVTPAFDERVMKVSPCAGKPAEALMLVNVPKLITAYYTEVPDPSMPELRVSFGTSGHRGSAFEKAFNEWHILAISQAICLDRDQKKINGLLFLGMDTHALSVLAADGVEIMIAQGDGYTPYCDGVAVPLENARILWQR